MAAGFILSYPRAAFIRIQLRSGSSSRIILGWRSGKPRSSPSIALKTDPAILSVKEDAARHASVHGLKKIPGTFRDYDDIVVSSVPALQLAVGGGV
jgi:hypothetical protein